MWSASTSSRFTRDEVAALVEAIVGERPADSLVDDLHRRSDGNPFFAEELLEASTTGRAIPATLRDALDGANRGPVGPGPRDAARWPPWPASASTTGCSPR